MKIESTAVQLLALLQHGDSQFPAGTFAFSSGLEGMLADATTSDHTLPHTIRSMLRCRWTPFDRVAVRLSWQAGTDWSAITALDTGLEASLLAPAERSGSVRTASALLRTHLELGTPVAVELRERIDAGELHGHRGVIEGVLWRHLGLGEDHATFLSGYAFVNVLCTAAVRLGRMGALAQQRTLSKLLPELETLAALPCDTLPRAFNPLAEIAVMRHPHRDRNLFAN